MKYKCVYVFFIILLFDKTLSKDDRPNFVIFFADDIGWGDFGANWAPNKDVTPNLNEMAEEGLRLTNFHSAASVCTPSRASLLTGRLGLRTGVVKNFIPESNGGLPLNETTIAEVLNKNGYNTGMIGKWHLGMTHLYHPRSRGFDFYYGLPYSNDMGCLDEFAYNLPECKTCPKKVFNWGKNMKKAVVCRNNDVAVPLYEDYNIIEQPVDLINLADKYALNAVNFIENSVKNQKPFLLYIAFAHMHAPLAHASRFTNSTNVKTVYADTLHEMDDVIGRVVKTLKVNNLFDNTLTWFTGDNGPWVEKCQFAGSQGPFLGSWLKGNFGGGSTAKTTTWEAGHREPTVLTWPKYVTPNQTSDALTSALDVFPTILSAAGVNLPLNRHFDGIDLNLFIKSGTQVANEVLYHPNSGGGGIIGEIDTLRLGSYKVFWKTGGIRGQDCGGKVAPLQDHDPPLVFNVKKDPAESTALTKNTEPNIDEIIAHAIKLREDLLLDIKHDNTSVVDYSTSSASKPCCDPNVFYCRCKKD